MGIKGKKGKCVVNPLPDDKILDWSKLKQSVDDNLKFYENNRKFSKWIENTVFSKGLFPRGVKRCYCVGMG